MRNSVRRAAVAGRFYPRDPEELRRVASRYVTEASVDSAPDRVLTVVSPHAGYVYSGPTAGHAYARVRGKEPGRVVLLGCSHLYYIDSASVYTSGTFETPLGNFPVDEPFAKDLAAAIGSFSNEPHEGEHSLEVQLPFLAVSVGVVPIVPVLFGGPAGEWHASAGEQIADMLGENDLVVASTDLSHYLSEPQANEIDKRSINSVLEKDWSAFARGVARKTCSMCGASAVVAAMACSLRRGAKDWRLLDYRTSAAASGDFERVVGYAAISMEKAA